jgi:hypothetical protein
MVAGNRLAPLPASGQLKIEKSPGKWTGGPWPHFAVPPTLNLDRRPATVGARSGSCPAASV